MGKEAAREKFVLAAFVGWQMGARVGVRFGDYLQGLGLTDDPAGPQEGEGISAEEAIAKADSILHKARAGQSENEQ